MNISRRNLIFLILLSSYVGHYLWIDGGNTVRRMLTSQPLSSQIHVRVMDPKRDVVILAEDSHVLQKPKGTVTEETYDSSYLE